MIIRLATVADREAIWELIAVSARQLSREHYTNEQIEAAIANVFGVDSDLIEDGTYFVVEIPDALIGCGGWSRRKALFGGDHYSRKESGYLDSQSEPARIRAFFIHPDHARKGVGRALLSRCETEAKAHGFRALELMSTLPGIAFYESCGFAQIGNYDLDLAGVKLELVPMRKEL
jgi:GNAT superfamily N-acetyltransferase